MAMGCADGNSQYKEDERTDYVRSSSFLFVSLNRGEIVMGKQLGICDIAYYAERMTVFEAPRVVKDKSENLRKIPQASHYVVRKLQAEKVISYRKGTERMDKVIEVVPIKSIGSVAKF